MTRDEKLTNWAMALAAGIALVCVVMIAVVIGTSGSESAPEPSAPATDHTVYTCQNEDGSGQPEDRYPCVWLGGQNGEGDQLLYLGPDTNPLKIETT